MSTDVETGIVGDDGFSPEQKSRIFASDRELPDVRVSNRFAGLNVLGLVADNSACGYYRVVNPLHYLKMNGANIHYGSHHSMDNFMKYDYIVAPRQHSEDVYEILRFVMWEGKTVIFEIDDDLDAVLPSSPAYYAYHHGSTELKMIHKVMSWCDGVTTTTREMAKWCYQNNKNVGILENLIDFSFRDWGAEVSYQDGMPIIKPLPLQRPKEWEGKTVVGWQGGCWTPDTEVLTENGWKTVLDLLPSEKIATLNPSTNCLEYHVPDSTVEYNYKGKLHHYRNGQVDMLLTPNHWMWNAKYQKDKSKATYEKIQSENVLGSKFWVQKNCRWEGENRDSFLIPFKGTDKRISTEHWMKFFGYWLGDGWTTKAATQVGICQFKDNNILSEVSAILTYYNISHSNKDSRILINDRTFAAYMLQFGHALTKRIPKNIKNLDSASLRSLFEAYIQTDGHKEINLGAGQKTGRIRAWTSSKGLSDDLCEIALKIGWAANVTTRSSKDGTIEGRILHSNGPSYQLNFLRSEGNRNYLTPLVSPKEQTEIDFNGQVYCVSVKNHLVYIRRNGKACWTHNTTHQEDLKVLGPQIKKLLTKYPKMHFAMYASPQQAEEFIKTYQIPDDRHTLVPARHFLDHPSGLHGVDIALAPLVCNQFNLAKSHLKCLEGMAVGTAMVTSNIGPYARFNTRHPGYIVNTGRGVNCIGNNLIEGVEFLLDNPDELRERQIKGRQLIFDRYSLEHNISDWPATWKYIHDMKLTGNSGPPEVKKAKREYTSYGVTQPNDLCPCQSGLKYKACCRDAWM